MAALALASLLSSCGGDFSALQISMPGEQAAVVPAPLPNNPVFSFQEVTGQVFSAPLFHPNPGVH